MSCADDRYDDPSDWDPEGLFDDEDEEFPAPDPGPAFHDVIRDLADYQPRT